MFIRWARTCGDGPDQLIDMISVTLSPFSQNITGYFYGFLYLLVKEQINYRDSVRENAQSDNVSVVIRKIKIVLFHRAVEFNPHLEFKTI